MTYKLFIDDERFSSTNDWIIVRSYKQAITFMDNMGCPKKISFDHDLGEEKSGLDIAKWIVQKDMDEKGKFIPDNFIFIIHSQNPVGKANIEGYLTSYLEFRNKFS